MPRSWLDLGSILCGSTPLPRVLPACTVGTMKNYTELYNLFNRCLTAEYVTVSNGADIGFQSEGDGLYIFFEKSDGLEDWINNLSFCVQPYGEMEHPWRCHGGFLRVFKSTREAINEALSDKKIRSVTLVGYSHGAALALLAQDGIDVEDIIE